MGVLRITDRLPRTARRFLRWVPGSAALRRVLTGTPRGPRPPAGSLRPVVYLPTWAGWDTMRQRPQYLLAAFAAAGHDVWFVDTRERAPRVVDGVRIVRSVRDVPAAHPILYIHFAPLRQLVGRFEDPLVVYDILDDLAIYDADEAGVPRSSTVRSHHARIVSDADVVLASAPALVERHRGERADLLLVENGVDVDRFAAPRSRPADLPDARPVIGYHGAVARWIDADLVAAVATARPEWSLVFVGPVLPDAGPLADRFGALPNVHLLGERSSDDVPAYVQAFDVSVIWFVVDDLTVAVSPLKLFESLAADVPVVSTPLPACSGIAGVRVADGVQQVIAAVEDALTARATETARRRGAAVAASWERRLRPVLERLDEQGRREVPG